ncbi:MAG: MMPL family transporter [Christensenellaceae bacterium]|nr:MMPL family transporter [Christensenellaceae bacterium]
MSQEKINTNLIDSIGGVLDANEGLKFLEDHFSIQGDAMFAVLGTDNDSELKVIMKELSSLDGIKQFVWYDSLDFLNSFGYFSRFINIDEFKAFLKRPALKDQFVYIALVTHEFEPSSSQSFELLKTIRSKLDGRQIAFAGMSATAEIVRNDTLGQMHIILIIATLTIFLVLILTSNSITELIITFLSVGVSVLLNFGSNYFFQSISIVGIAMSALIQICIGVDFSLIFLHIYRKQRGELSALVTLKHITPTINIIIFSSVLTASAVFISSLFIELSLGKELMLMLIKGIVFSQITSLLIIPSLIVIFDKFNFKLSIRPLIDFGATASVMGKSRTLIISLFLVFATFSVLFQSNITLSYFQLHPKTTQINQVEESAELLSHQLIIVVPVIPDNGTQKDFIDELKSIEKVNTVLGAFSALEINEKLMLPLLELGVLKIDSNLSGFFSKVDDKWYTMSTIILNGTSEDANAIDSYNEIVSITSKYFESHYRFGVLAAVSDISKISAKDFPLIFLFALLFLFIMLLLFTRSFTKSLLSTLVSMVSTFAVIGFASFDKVPINFLIYLIFCIFQAARVGVCSLYFYSSLNSSKKSTFLPNASDSTTYDLSNPIIRSTLCFSLTCFILSLFTKNLIVKHLTIFLGLGNILSSLLILTVLPSVLSLFETNTEVSIKKE